MLAAKTLASLRILLSASFRVKRFKGKYGSMQEVSVLITSASTEDSGESALTRRLARAFAARIHKIWMWMKAQTKIKISCYPRHVSMGVYRGSCAYTISTIISSAGPIL